MAMKALIADERAWRRAAAPRRSTGAIHALMWMLLVFATPLIGCVAAAQAQDEAIRDAATRIVQEEIGRFAGEFPEIEFVWLGGKAYAADMQTLSHVLEERHELLDYEHQAHQVETLNSLNLGRIKMMLAYESPSSSLYRVWNNKTHGKSYVVVITLSPSSLTGDHRSSTCYMYDIDIANYGSISKQSRVKNADYLRYVVRHEIAHALKAYLFSGHAFTHEPLGGDYNSFLAEIWADMFAVMMEQQFGSGDRDFIRNLVDARTISLVRNNDVQHFTSRYLEGALETNPPKPSDLRQLADLVQAEYLKVMPSYGDYEVLALTAYHLRYALEGSRYDMLTHTNVIAEYEVDSPHEGLLAQLVEEAEAAMHRVFR